MGHWSINHTVNQARNLDINLSINFVAIFRMINQGRNFWINSSMKPIKKQLIINQLIAEATYHNRLPSFAFVVGVFHSWTSTSKSRLSTSTVADFPAPAGPVSTRIFEWFCRTKFNVIESSWSNLICFDLVYSSKVQIGPANHDMLFCQGGAINKFTHKSMPASKWRRIPRLKGPFFITALAVLVSTLLL